MNIKEDLFYYMGQERSRTEVQELRQQGLALLHKGLLHSLELGCQPHSSAARLAKTISELEQAATMFLKAARPGIKGALTSNMRLASLAILEACSLRVDVESIDRDHDENTQFALNTFSDGNELLGVSLAKVIQNINSRHSGGFDLPFNLKSLMTQCADVVAIDEVKAVLARRAGDITAFDTYSHAFPERDVLLLTLLHSSLSFEEWQLIYEDCQRASLPHFELEISSILIAYIVAVATAVTSSTITEFIKIWINNRPKAKKKIRESINNSEIEKILEYLLLGYSLREFHLENPEKMDLEAFKIIWGAVRYGNEPPEKYREIVVVYKKYAEKKMLKKKWDAPALLAELNEVIIEHIIQSHKDDRN